MECGLDTGGHNARPFAGSLHFGQWDGVTGRPNRRRLAGLLNELRQTWNRCHDPGIARHAGACNGADPSACEIITPQRD